MALNVGTHYHIVDWFTSHLPSLHCTAANSSSSSRRISMKNSETSQRLHPARMMLHFGRFRSKDRTRTGSFLGSVCRAQSDEQFSNRSADNRQIDRLVWWLWNFRLSVSGPSNVNKERTGPRSVAAELMHSNYRCMTYTMRYCRPYTIICLRLECSVSELIQLINHIASSIHRQQACTDDSYLSVTRHQWRRCTTLYIWRSDNSRTNVFDTCSFWCII